MLRITIPKREFFNEETGEFIYMNEQTLQMEHSLISLSKWEAKWNKAFLSRKEKTLEETLDYFRCMTINKEVDPQIFRCLSSEQVEQINNYIDAPMTATYFAKNQDTTPSRETVTAELIYYWMISFNIPFECQKWHLNRLIALIKVCQLKSTPPKKMNPKDIARRNAALNAARRKKHHTKG